MKILHLISSLALGGAQTTLFNLLEAGLDKGFINRIVVLTGSDNPGGRFRVPCRSLDMPRGGLSVPGLWRLRSEVGDFRPELIQGWMYHGNLAATVSGWVAPGRPPVVWNVRQCLYSLAAEKPLTQVVIRANRRLSRRADAIVYNCGLSRQQHERFGFSSDRGMVVPNGFDLNRFCPDREAGMHMRRKLNLPVSAPVVGHVARFHPMKDHALFLRAAVRVAEARPNVRFLLIGRDVGLDNPGLKGLVPGPLEERFVCLGERRDVPDLMQAMDMLCQSSWSEAFPNVLGEAMASAVPCVATDVGESREILGDTGAIVPPRDEDGMVEGLLDMLARLRKEGSALGQAARARIESNFSLSAAVEQFSSLYGRLHFGGGRA